MAVVLSLAGGGAEIDVGVDELVLEAVLEAIVEAGDAEFVVDLSVAAIVCEELKEEDSAVVSRAPSSQYLLNTSMAEVFWDGSWVHADAT